jgi:hypothetical protein
MHHFLTLCIIHSIGLDYSGFRNYKKLDCKYAFRKASFNALFLISSRKGGSTPYPNESDCPVTGLLDPLCLLALLGDAASISIELALERRGPKSALDPVS